MEHFNICFASNKKGIPFTDSISELKKTPSIGVLSKQNSLLIQLKRR
jgi:hypothetical protein